MVRTHKDIANNRLVIGQGHEHPLMQSTQLWSESIDWVAGEQKFQYRIPMHGKNPLSPA
jgi:tRNA U34 2-thiouridine synthase MnmA/TrmU